LSCLSTFRGTAICVRPAKLLRKHSGTPWVTNGVRRPAPLLGLEETPRRPGVKPRTLRHWCPLSPCGRGGVVAFEHSGSAVGQEQWHRELNPQRRHTQPRANGFQVIKNCLLLFATRVGTRPAEQGDRSVLPGAMDAMSSGQTGRSEWAGSQASAGESGLNNRQSFGLHSWRVRCRLPERGSRTPMEKHHESS
jgi:hypothetical protein